MNIETIEPGRLNLSPKPETNRFVAVYGELANGFKFLNGEDQYLGDFTPSQAQLLINAHRAGREDLVKFKRIYVQRAKP